MLVKSYAKKVALLFLKLFFYMHPDQLVVEPVPSHPDQEDQIHLSVVPLAIQVPTVPYLVLVLPVVHQYPLVVQQHLLVLVRYLPIKKII